jgi:hypothetical protein
MRTDRRTDRDMPKLIIAFPNFGNAPKYWFIACIHKWLQLRCEQPHTMTAYIIGVFWISRLVGTVKVTDIWDEFARLPGSLLYLPLRDSTAMHKLGHLNYR